jgi:hypothetical protein
MADETDKKTEPIKETSSTSNEGIEDVILDVAWKDYATSSEDKRALDTKANMILVASGVLLGLVINGISIMDTSFAILAAGLLILASIFCILALNIRTYSALGAMKTWDAVKKENNLDNPKQAKRDIMATIDKAVENNRIQTQKIADMIKPANVLFISALVIIALAILLHYAMTLCPCSGLK